MAAFVVSSWYLVFATSLATTTGQIITYRGEPVETSTTRPPRPHSSGRISTDSSPSHYTVLQRTASGPASLYTTFQGVTSDPATLYVSLQRTTGDPASSHTAPQTTTGYPASLYTALQATTSNPGSPYTAPQATTSNPANLYTAFQRAVNNPRNLHAIFEKTTSNPASLYVAPQGTTSNPASPRLSIEGNGGNLASPHASVQGTTSSSSEMSSIDGAASPTEDLSAAGGAVANTLAASSTSGESGPAMATSAMNSSSTSSPQTGTIMDRVAFFTSQQRSWHHTELSSDAHELSLGSKWTPMKISRSANRRWTGVDGSLGEADLATQKSYLEEGAYDSSLAKFYTKIRAKHHLFFKQKSKATAQHVTTTPIPSSLTRTAYSAATYNSAPISELASKDVWMPAVPTITRVAVAGGTADDSDKEPESGDPVSTLWRENLHYLSGHHLASVRDQSRSSADLGVGSGPHVTLQQSSISQPYLKPLAVTPRRVEPWDSYRPSFNHFYHKHSRRPTASPINLPVGTTARPFFSSPTSIKEHAAPIEYSQNDYVPDYSLHEALLESFGPVISTTSLPLLTLPVAVPSTTPSFRWPTEQRAPADRMHQLPRTYSPAAAVGSGALPDPTRPVAALAALAFPDSRRAAPTDNVPGRAGRDYPTYSRPPRTGFTCRGKVHGMYADFEARCQAWHRCHENGHDSFVCVTGTVFSPVSHTCDWWYNVDCRYEAFPPY